MSTNEMNILVTQDQVNEIYDSLDIGVGYGFFHKSISKNNLTDIPNHKFVKELLESFSINSFEKLPSFKFGLIMETIGRHRQIVEDHWLHLGREHKIADCFLCDRIMENTVSSQQLNEIFDAFNEPLPAGKVPKSYWDERHQKREELNKKFNVTTMALLPKEKFNEVIRYINNEKNKNIKTGITTIEFSSEDIRKINSKEELKKAILKQLGK